jgi:hypothetical protein
MTDDILDPDEESAPNDDAPDTDPDPAPPREADVSPFEPGADAAADGAELGGEG